MLRPGSKAPALVVRTVSGPLWNLHHLKPEKFSLIVFYRGLHCPICKDYLKSLNSIAKGFREQGATEIIAISGDTKQKAKQAKQGWALGNIKIGYGQSIKSMAEWGLFISSSLKNEEPDYFGEPGLFLVDQDTRLFYCSTNSMPFARPHFADLLDGLKFINDRSYPLRGSVNYEEITTQPEALVEWESEMEMIDNHIVSDPAKEKSTPPLRAN